MTGTLNKIISEY